MSYSARQPRFRGARLLWALLRRVAVFYMEFEHGNWLRVEGRVERLPDDREIFELVAYGGFERHLTDHVEIPVQDGCELYFRPGLVQGHVVIQSVRRRIAGIGLVWDLFKAQQVPVRIEEGKALAPEVVPLQDEGPELANEHAEAGVVVDLREDRAIQLFPRSAFRGQIPQTDLQELLVYAEQADKGKCLRIDDGDGSVPLCRELPFREVDSVFRPAESRDIKQAVFVTVGHPVRVAVAGIAVFQNETAVQADFFERGREKVDLGRIAALSARDVKKFSVCADGLHIYFFFILIDPSDIIQRHKRRRRRGWCLNRSFGRQRSWSLGRRFGRRRGWSLKRRFGRNRGRRLSRGRGWSIGWGRGLRLGRGRGWHLNRSFGRQRSWNLGRRFGRHRGWRSGGRFGRNRGRRLSR